MPAFGDKTSGPLGRCAPRHEPQQVGIRAGISVMEPLGIHPFSMPCDVL